MWAQKVHELGPKFGYFLNPHKLVFLVPNGMNERAQLALSKTPFSKAHIQNGGTLLGGYIGDTEGMEGFVKKKVDKLCEGLSKLLSLDKTIPRS